MATTPATVRWLLCGRGRPVDDTSPRAAYTVVLTPDRDFALFANIEPSWIDEMLTIEPPPLSSFGGPPSAHT